MKLTLPLPPNRANAREHWRTTDKRKRAYYNKADAALIKAMPPGTDITIVAGKTRRSPFRPRLAFAETWKMRLGATFYVWNLMDRGNAVARLKWVEDALVNFGLLVDDNEEWLDLQMPTQVIDRKNTRVEITLEPIDNTEPETPQ